MQMSTFSAYLTTLPKMTFDLDVNHVIFDHMNNKMVLEPNVSPYKQIIKDNDSKECISIE